MKYFCFDCHKKFKIPKSTKKVLKKNLILKIYCPYCYSLDTYNIGRIKNV